MKLYTLAGFERMPAVETTTFVAASLEACFDASRDIGLHVRSLRGTNETVVGGRTTGLICLGESVVFRGKHFGLYHEHESRITAFDRPHHFRDEMIRGRFQRFRHDHHFVEVPGGTEMRDVVEFASPFGVLGRLVDSLILRRYVHRLIQSRSNEIRDYLQN